MIICVHFNQIVTFVYLYDGHSSDDNTNALKEFYKVEKIDYVVDIPDFGSELFCHRQLG